MIEIALVILAVVVTALLMRGFDARRMPPLEIWHRAGKVGEIEAGDLPPGTDLAAYRALEDGLFERLDRHIFSDADPPGTRFHRYRRGSDSDPSRAEGDYNRTFELGPEEAPTGGVLALHGLTDSPYSVRAVAQLCASHRYRVVAPRVPGHGTVPGELTRVHRDDWRAAVRVAAAEVAGRLPAGAPFVLCGYSTGGALALDYTLDALERGDLRVPDRLILFSPAVGVSFAAAMANWHKAISWIPYFRQLEWASIYPEYDPFKFNSFPKNAGDQVHLLTKGLKSRLARLARGGGLESLPPILSFQSIVDTTILVDALIDKLYALLPRNGSELVLFDINRWTDLSEFLKSGHDTLLEGMAARPELPHDLTLVTNATASSREVVARTRSAGAADFDRERPLGLEWPDQVYSLSHVAICFPPDDPYYGSEAGNAEGDPFHLGTLQPRGERKQLKVPIGQLMRLRHNPFFPYIEERMSEALTAPPGAAPRR